MHLFSTEKVSAKSISERKILSEEIWKSCIKNFLSTKGPITNDKFLPLTKHI